MNLHPRALTYPHVCGYGDYFSKTILLFLVRRACFLPTQCSVLANTLSQVTENTQRQWQTCRSHMMQTWALIQRMTHLNHISSVLRKLLEMAVALTDMRQILTSCSAGVASMWPVLLTLKFQSHFPTGNKWQYQKVS